MKMRLLIRSQIGIFFLCGPIAVGLVTAADERFIERNATLQCKVDSRFYSSPYSENGGELSGVPLREGTVIIINWSRLGNAKVLIEEERRFSSCDDPLFPIANAGMAKNLLSETKISDVSMFVGASVGVCRTADEGWFFMLKKTAGYIGYAGPAPLPLAVVGMKCE